MAPGKKGTQANKNAEPEPKKTSNNILNPMETVVDFQDQLILIWITTDP